MANRGRTTRRRTHDSPADRVRRLLVRQRRRLRCVRAAETAALCATAGALTAAAVELVWLVAGLSLRWYPGVWLWFLPVVFIVVSAGCGALVSLLRPLSLRRAARVLDARAGLRDRLATAAELIDSPQADESVVSGVCLQALWSADSAGACHVSLWSRGRSTAAALGLSVLLAGALLPPAATLPRRQSAEVVSAVRRMTPDEREQVVEALGRLADEAGLDESFAEVAEAEDAIRRADAERLALSLAKLRRAGVDVSALMQRETAEQPGGGEVTDHADIADADSPAEAQRAAVRVYSPGMEEDGEPLQSHSSAWSRAQSRAADALAAGRIPPRYRPLVRRYFDED
ncbi:MAG: hypothetical protein ACLFVW_05920 [Phycisphaerae bacterium]